MSGHEPETVDQVDDILEMFYADEELLDIDEQEDLAFYDLYQDDKEEIPNEGLWISMLKPDDIDQQDNETDDVVVYEPLSRHFRAVIKGMTNQQLAWENDSDETDIETDDEELLDESTLNGVVADGGKS